MRIQHNIPAMNSYRNYSNNVSKVAKNLEKLSTGYKINRAGDDAAGLAISEKMRIQITGLEKAQDNAKAGINLVQTAEGALTEVHDMLNRMFDLAEQSANGTFDDSVDRNQLQKEITQLRDEIDRIADSTNYNGIKLLDGSMEKKTVSSAVTDLAAGLAAGATPASADKLSFTRLKDGDPGQEPQAGVFYMDLENQSLTAKGDNEKLEMIVFGEALDLGTYDQGKGLAGKELVNKIVEKWNETAATKELGGDAKVKMHASVSLDQKSVVFTMENPPAANWTLSSTVQFQGNFIDNKGSEKELTTDVQPVSTKHPRTYAQAQFTLDAKTVSNGTTLQIGNETYVFAVGRNSRYTDMNNVIDLTDFEEADFADAANGAANLKIAAMRLTNVAAGNSMFKVGNNTNSAVINLTEREDAVDYTVNNLQGTAGTELDGDWSGLVKVGIVDSKNSTEGLTLQIGDTAEKFNQLNVSVKDMHVSALNLSKIDISEQGGAQTAMNLIKAATNYVSDVRGSLGALQNRLDHTINNLSVAQENIQDAEATIRDVDVAKEMMAYTKNNILVQSAQAMLAQANAVPQGVLQLLG